MLGNKIKAVGQIWPSERLTKPVVYMIGSFGASLVILGSADEVEGSKGGPTSNPTMFQAIRGINSLL